MAAAKIKKGDSVVVLSGKDKGRTGTVQKVMPKEGKIVVEGVNVAARHRKPSQANPQGGIDRFEAPMPISKVAVAGREEGPHCRQVRGDHRWLTPTLRASRPATKSRSPRR
jgi:large subunit ribosomal protein L24